MPNQIQILKSGLDNEGYRLTTPRLHVLKAILCKKGRFSAYDIEKDTPTVGRATVFRTIKLLVMIGLLCKVTLENGSPKYRLSRPSHHHHFICVTCGRVDDFVAPDLDNAMSRFSYATSNKIVGHRIEVYDVCLACQRSNGSTEVNKWR